MNFGDLKDREELMLSIPSGNAYVNSTPQRDDIRTAYEKTAYAFDWPQFLVKRGIPIVANNKKYALPTVPTLRKIDYIYVLGVKHREVSLDMVHKTPNSYAVDLSTEELIISGQPSTDPTEYTLSNAESAGNEVVVELDSTTGLSVGDEVFLNDATNPEVTYIQSIVAGTSVTVRLDSSKSASTILYRAKEIIMISYYRTVNTLTDDANEPLLPSAVHPVMLYWAVGNAYMRLEQYDEAQKNFDLWEREMRDYWRAFDSASSGPTNSFSIA